jgi:hypothetical protein
LSTARVRGLRRVRSLRADPSLQGGRYHCVTVEGWDYWLTHAGADGWIVNRKRSAEAGWDHVPLTRDKRELIRKERADELLRELES